MRHLFMRRADLANLPPMPPLPPGYHLREYRPDDIASFSTLMCAAFEDAQWSEERLMRVLIDAPDTKRILVIEYNGEIVASASARLLYDQYPDAGYLHWVAVAPAHRGKRLGYDITLAALYASRELGCQEAVLETDDHRHAAIKIYQELGFIPEYRHESHAERWVAVFADMLSAANL